MKTAEVLKNVYDLKFPIKMTQIPHKTCQVITTWPELPLFLIQVDPIPTRIPQEMEKMIVQRPKS